MWLLTLMVMLTQPAEQLLDQAKSALRRGDGAEYDALIRRADEAIDRDTNALRDRLAAHRLWDECVRLNAVRVSALSEGADALADSVLGMCSDQESTVFVRAGKTISDQTGAEKAATLNRMMEDWRSRQRREALAIIVRSRLDGAVVIDRTVPQD